ncbi:hypothetical protein NIES267_71690 (plasmid) [Calothrix parasitica NIES-267]|uniref:Uncharacterized protein n=1 Tax=Calothrix parasitica NIES-267 TaxID=1973488 RepID=A0A1Z4M2G1_9CYAN|nr:hypothetical protein NIES267_71690 [Calothrix parasitica NIES-267]
MQQIDFERLAQNALFTEEAISFNVQDTELHLISCQGKAILFVIKNLPMLYEAEVMRCVSVQSLTFGNQQTFSN